MVTKISKSNTTAPLLCEKIKVNAPFVFLVLTAAGVGAFSATDNLYWKDSGYTLSELGLTAAAFNMGVVLAELPFAIYFDRYSNKKALMAGNICRFLAFFIFFVDGGFAWIIFGQLMAGVGYAAASGTTEALIMNEVESADSAVMTRRYSKVYFWSSFSALIAGSAGVGLYFIAPGLIWLSAMAFFAVAGLVIIFMRDVQANDVAMPWPEFRKGLFKSVRLPETYLLVLVNSAAVAPFIFWQIKMGELSLFVLLVGFFAMKGMGALASVAVDRIKIRPVTIYFVMVINAGIVSLFAYTNNAIALPLVFGLHVLAHATLTILAYGKFHSSIENNVRASSGSVVSLMDSLLVAVFAPFVGWLADSGSLVLAILASTVVYMLMLLYWVAINRVRKIKGGASFDRAIG